MSRRLRHILFGFLLLLAQQGALVHTTWHAGADALAGHTHGQAGPESPFDQSSQGTLCAFDLPFGQVLGGMHGSCAQPITAEPPAVYITTLFQPRLSVETVPALSRGPPVLL